MKLIDIIKLSLDNLSQRGLRSWLTILGIIIGIAAVTSILSVGEGMKQTISSQLATFGADMLTITPGYTRATREFEEVGRILQARYGTSTSILNDKDVRTLKNVEGVKYVTPTLSGRGEVKYLGETVILSIQGIEPIFFEEFMQIDLEKGRFLWLGDKDVVVVGNDVPNMFKNGLPINSKIDINGKSFKVVGILEKSGGLVGMIGIDRTIYMPISSAKEVLNISSNQYNMILVKVESLELLDETIKNIETNLMISRKVREDTKDFTITSVKTIQERILSVMGTVNFFLAGIAAISLLVGGVGIANTMFTSVIERTRQIGTLKSLGATNGEIMKMFLIESALIGLIGGLLGIFLGFVVSGIISEAQVRMIGIGMVRTMSITTITPRLILFGIGFSVFIGILSGLFPARKAARLQPVEALRYE